MQNVDPKTILFSIPTLSDDIAPLAPVTGRTSNADLVFHEDEWSHPVQELERLLAGKTGSAPILFASSAVGGRVQNGFSLPLGGNVTLYGHLVGQNVQVLGAHLGQNADDLKLTEAFMKLSVNIGVLLVDWRRQLILVLDLK